MPIMHITYVHDHHRRRFFFYYFLFFVDAQRHARRTSSEIQLQIYFILVIECEIISIIAQLTVFSFVFLWYGSLFASGAYLDHINKRVCAKLDRIEHICVCTS